MSDSSQIVLQYLTAAGSLRTYLGGVYVSTPVAPAAWKNDTKAIIFHAETEGRHVAADHNSTVFVFKCYGGSDSFTAARGVYQALVDYLHNARGKVVAAGRIKLAYLVTAFQGPADPETGWPVMLAKFQIETEAV